MSFAAICGISRVSPLCGHTLTHTWQQTTLVSTAAALPGKAKPAQQTLYPPQVVLQPAVANCPLCPIKLGQDCVPAGSGMLGQRGCCQLPLCLGAAQQGACPCTDASGTPARNANAEGSGKEGLGNGLQPTSGRLEAPHEPVQLSPTPGLVGSSTEETAPNSPRSCSPALLTGLGLWPFWLLGTGAAREEKTS